MTASDWPVVEGFDEIITGGEKRQIRDFRGQTDGWTTEPWWRSGPLDGLAWYTAVCPKKADTVFSFVGTSPSLPYGRLQGHQAEMVLNGRVVVRFDLGVRWEQEWHDGDFQLSFTPRRTQTPFDGYHRLRGMNGNSGIYRLSVPKELIEGGQRARIEVRLLAGDLLTPAWFAVIGRTDTLERSKETLEQELRALQHDYRRLKDVVNSLARAVYKDDFPEWRDVEHSVIRTHERNCLMNPDIERLAGGDLLLSFRESAEHMLGSTESILSRVCTLRSSDDGKTWGDFTVVYEREREDHRDPTTNQLRDGTVLYHWIYNASWDPTGGKLPESEQAWYQEIVRSYDGGHSWEPEPYTVEAATPSEGGYSVISTEKCVELPSGRILMPVYFHYPDDPLTHVPEDRVDAVYSSDDRGRSWQHLSTVCDGRDPATAILHGPTEPAIIRTGSGRIVMLMRTEPPDGHLWQSVSHDEGATWQQAWKTPLYAGSPPNILLLSNGALALTYGYRGGRYDKPESAGIRATVSYDEGDTWEEARVLRDDFPNNDHGYTSSVQLNDGRVLTVYWYNMFERYFLAGTVWSPGSR